MERKSEKNCGFCDWQCGGVLVSLLLNVFLLCIVGFGGNYLKPSNNDMRDLITTLQHKYDKVSNLVIRIVCSRF